MNHASFVAVLAAILVAPGAVRAAPAAVVDCHVGAYALSDGSVIDLAPTDGGALRYRQFDGTTGVLHEAKDGAWTSTLGWTERPDGKRVVPGPCGSGELRVDELTGKRIDFDVV